MKKNYLLAFVALLLSGILSTVEAADMPIQTLPEGGTTTLYSRSGGCYYAYAGNNYATMEYDYLPIEVVEYENGDVYIKDIISQYDYSYYNVHSYIKGHKDGSVISFQLPQMVVTQTWGTTTYHYYVSMVEYSNKKQNFVPLADADNVYTLNIKDDGSLVADQINNGLEFIGMIDDDKDWCYYGEVFMTLNKVTETPVTAPAGLNTIDMRAITGEVSRDVVMGFDGDDVYLKGLFELNPQAWIKGQKNGDKVSFASGQYLGLSESGNFLSYFMAGEFEQSTAAEEERTLKATEAITYDYDVTTGNMTTGADNLMVYNKNPKYINYMEYVESPQFQQVSENASKQPKDPWNVSFKCYDPAKPYAPGQIMFVASELNVDGLALNDKNLYYRLFINGEPFVFTKNDFYSIEGDMTFVPYNYSDQGGSIATYGANHFIYGYECFQNITSVGVQICYIEGEAKEENIVAQSKIVTYPAPAVTNYTPKNPENVVFKKAEKAWEYTTLTFEVDAVNTDGEDLNTDNLYYAVYFDHNDTPVEFKKPDYYYVTDAMTYVPYNFVDYQTTGADFMVDGNKRTVYVYDKSVNVAGVRLVYIEGEPTAANIVAQSDIVYPSVAKNYTPKNPENVVFKKAEKAWEYTTLTFEVDAVNTDGEDLNTDNLYYAVYFDHNDTPVEFKKPDYYYVTDAMTYVPYNFVDYQTTGADFMVDGNKRTVYVYDKSVNVAGVRLVYIEGEPSAANIVAQSDIVYPSVAKNYTPKNPENVVFKKAEKAWEYTTLTFEVDAVNTDGEDLNTDNLYYAVYFDHNDTPVEFKKPDYYYVTDAMTYVPYNFVDYQTTGADFMVNGNKRTVYVYDKSVNVAGVRLVYIEGEPSAANIVAQSDIVYPTTSGIDSIYDQDAIASVVYYNVAGIVVENPTNGIFIKVVTYTDGKVETTKVRL